MKRIGVFYGSTTGNTEQVAHLIAENLGVADTDVHDVAKSAPSDVAPYDVLIFGASTWGDGDLQDDMHDFLDGLSSLDLKGKTAAVFGCGDESMSDTFCNGVDAIYKAVSKTGAEMTGAFDASVFDFNHSDAVEGGIAEGLLIDNMNHEDLTADRVKRWCDEIKQSVG